MRTTRVHLGTRWRCQVGPVPARFWCVWHTATNERSGNETPAEAGQSDEGIEVTVKVTVERLPESQVKLDIVADEQEFAEAVEKAARKVAKDVQVPGFRKGKVPRHMIERLYGREVFLEEAGRLIMDDLYREAIESEDLNPVGNPSVVITEADPIAFTVTVPVYPEVDPGDYLTVRADPKDAAVEQSEIDEVVERVRRQSSPWVDPAVERTPAEGDEVTLDLVIFEGDDQFQEPIEDARFIIGESDLFPELRTAIESLKPGESTDATLTFEEDNTAAAEHLRGKTLRYTVTLKGIKERELLDLNDEFATTYAGEESLDDMLASVRKDLHRGKTNDMRNEVLNSIIDQIGEGANIAIPSVMVDDSVQQEIERMRQRFQMQRSSLEAYLRSNNQSLAELAEELRPTVATQLRNTLTLREIAKREGIEISDADLDAEIDAIVADAPEPERMRQIYGADSYMRSVIRDELFNELLTDRLIEIGTEGKGAVTSAYEPEDGESTGRGVFRGSRRKSGGKKAAAAKSDAVEEAAGEVATTPAAGSTQPLDGGECPDDFPIKGNLSSLIYHQHGQSSYANTEAEICFATTDDAEAAGYRASKAAGAIQDAAEVAIEAAKELKGETE